MKKCIHAWLENVCYRCGMGKYDDGDIAVRAIRKHTVEDRLKSLEEAVRELKQFTEMNCHGGH